MREKERDEKRRGEAKQKKERECIVVGERYLCKASPVFLVGGLFGHETDTVSIFT